MTQTKTAYRVTGQNVGMLVTELNFLLQQIGQRLDQIEGLRGNPKFFSATLEFDPAISGYLTAAAGGDSATFVQWDFTDDDVTTVQGLTANTRATRFYDDNDTLIHSFGAST